MICPMLKQGNTVPPCKRDGGDKGTPCAWWDHEQKRCSIVSIANSLSGIERVLTSLFELSEVAGGLSELWYKDPEQENEDIVLPSDALGDKDSVDEGDDVNGER